ncbi:MAG: hypothetical protein HYZ11_03765 [Candidatus Tectomicrobia bacterium]|uniref:Uncharacterized protein n=1 Tax=Tectimicrobiota bacterium TaxID=2528274 RepID=A0A932MMH8_UNCTE|nr:hypothetical protein [Candidatus Tectomicrobia bacterium]
MKIINLSAMPGPHFFRELEAAGLGGKASLRSAVLEGGGEQPQLLLHDEAAEAAVMAVVAAHNPVPPTFAGESVLSAQDVDRVTSKRILAYLAPQWAEDARMQERHVLRALQDVARAQDVKRDPASYTQADITWADQAIAQARTKDAQVLAYRQEAADFKAARGW